MNCPRCSGEIPSNDLHCVHCGFQMSQVDDVLGYHDVPFEPLMDLSGSLRRPERERLLRQIQNLERRFPQLLIGVFFGALSERLSVGEFGFWLLNHAAPKEADSARPNQNGIILCVDVNSRQAGLTIGYVVERFVNADDLMGCLKAARIDYMQSDFESGTRRLLKRLDKMLARRAHEVWKNPYAVVTTRPGWKSAPLTGLPPKIRLTNEPEPYQV